MSFGKGHTSKFIRGAASMADRLSPCTRADKERPKNKTVPVYSQWIIASVVNERDSAAIA